MLDRDIVGTGLHTGDKEYSSRLIPGPWRVGTRATCFDSYETSRLALSSSAIRLSQMRFYPVRPLAKINSISAKWDVQSIRTGEENSGTFFRMNISMKPRVRFQTIEGAPAYRPLLDGDFYVIAHLVLNNSGPQLKDRIILTSIAEQSELQEKNKDLGVVGTGKVIDGKLIVHVSTFVAGRLPQGNLELALKVIPKGIRGLAPAEGIYELGAMGSLSSSRSGDLTKACREETGKCDFTEYIKNSKTYQEMVAAETKLIEADKAKGLPPRKRYAAPNSPYLFDRLNLRFTQVETGETTTQRTVTYTASTCINDAFTGERPVGLPFTITDKKTGKVIAHSQTGEDGCLRWNAQIFHKYYQPEQFLEQNVVITKDSGYSRDVTFYINPWDDKFTFGFDEREFSEDFWAAQKKTQKKFLHVSLWRTSAITPYVFSTTSTP